MTARPTVALALGGGGARGLAHIHVVEVLDEYGLRPSLICGASIGALIGAAAASGMTGAEIRAHVLSSVGGRREVLNRLWSLRPASLADALAGGFGFNRVNLERVLAAFLPERLPAAFEDLPIPLELIASDYYGQAECLLDRGPLMPALAASAALPAIFRPVTIGGRVLIDGALWNPVPFDRIAGRADITIGVDVIGSPPGDAGEVPGGIDSLYGAAQLTMRSIVRLKLAASAPDIYLSPEVGRFRVLDFLKAEEILAESAGIRDELRRALDERLAAFA